MKNNMKKENNKRNDGGKLRVMSLGGLQEIGKNMTVIEYGDDILIVDCGLGFPDDEMLGVDLVIPDVSYLVENKDKVRGIVLTHGHEDHIGALPYVLKSLPVPVYGTKLTLGIVENKLMEYRFEVQPKLFCVDAGDVIRLGVFTAEFIHVNHSIADACAIAIGTPQGTVFHTGDFKLDLTPIEFGIISALCKNAGNVVTTQELFEAVWGEKYLDSSNTVMVHIRRIREKMREKPRNPKFIKTVWGVGYKIEKDI